MKNFKPRPRVPREDIWEDMLVLFWEVLGEYFEEFG